MGQNFVQRKASISVLGSHCSQTGRAVAFKDNEQRVFMARVLVLSADVRSPSVTPETIQFDQCCSAQLEKDENIT